jgi:glycosyltransferase involved in cell wall biosynthesis
VGEVAVVVPAHNPGQYLRETIASLIAQSFREWEAVVVDDGSSEDLSWVGTADPRLRLIRNERARGPAHARNRGVELTSAPLIAFLDADDIWLPRKLEAQLSAIEGADVSATWCDLIDDTSRRIGDGYRPALETYASLLAGNPIALCTAMVRRPAFLGAGGFREEVRGTEDWDLWLRLAQQGCSFVAVPEVLALYRLHANNLSADYRNGYRTSKEILRRHPVPESRVGMRRNHQLSGAIAYDQARNALRRRDWIKLIDALAFALHHAPSYTVRALMRHALDR